MRNNEPLPISEDEVNVQLCGEFKHKFIERGDSYLSYSTVQCDAPTVCLIIGRSDLARVAPPLMMRSLYNTLDECFVCEADIKDGYVEKLNWERDRKRIYEDLQNERRLRKLGEASNSKLPPGINK